MLLGIAKSKHDRLEHVLKVGMRRSASVGVHVAVNTKNTLLGVVIGNRVYVGDTDPVLNAVRRVVKIAFEKALTRENDKTVTQENVAGTSIRATTTLEGGGNQGSSVQAVMVVTAKTPDGVVRPVFPLKVTQWKPRFAPDPWMFVRS